MPRFSDALERLMRGGIEVILLDLTLPDLQGIEAYEQAFRAAPSALILVLCGPNNEALALAAVQRGAHDYIAKAHIDAHWLPRALRYMIDRQRTERALHKSEACFRVMSDASPLGIFVSDNEGRCIYTNAAYQKIAGLSFDQSLGTNWSMAIHPEDRERVLAQWRIAARSQEPFQMDYRFLRNDLSVVWTRVNSSVMRDEKTHSCLIQTIEDITERKATEFALRAAEDALFSERERAQVTLNSIGDAVLSTDSAGVVTYLNRVAEKMTGWLSRDAVGRPLAKVFRIINAKTREDIANPAQRAISEDKTVDLGADSVLIRRDGFESAIEDSSAPIHVRGGQTAGAVIVFHDVSYTRSMATKMAHLAQHDFLTNLPNRSLLTERLNQAIRFAQRHAKQVALLFLDLDYFKHINDSLGHTIGDLLLQSVGNRLVSCVRSSDTVCRQGGDEFVILLAEIEKLSDAALIAEKLIAAFAAPHFVSGHALHVTLSIGISVYPDDGLSAESVMQNADTAMYHAKDGGRNNFQFFTKEMNTVAVRRLSIENGLRRALKQGEFHLYYQPQVDVASGALKGVEALIRWLDPEHGLVLPEQFVSIAEDCGLIVPIGRWVLREACRQVKFWQDSALSPVPVSVNISALEFRHGSFLEAVSKILQETGLAPDYLELELTEGLLMHDAEESALVLGQFKGMGVKLAIDDFGTGYSSLSYLKRFPINTLKIDQSFVRDIECDPDGATIVSAVIGMGKNLRLRVVAEGVETHGQLTFLQTHHCPEGQGLLFSPPLAAEEFTRLLEARKSRAVALAGTPEARVSVPAP